MKSAEWESLRRRLKPRFERAGITRCELRFPGCWRDNALGFAHAKKRRNLSEAEYGEVILACTSCHGIIERRPENEMADIVRATIRGRKTQVT